jgi:hypothetical protein
MNSIAETPKAPAARPVRLVLMALVLAAAIIATVALRAAFGSGAATPPHLGPAPTSHAIEARYGIRITQIGLTADGGMLDMRFVLLDPQKAHQLGHGGVKMSMLAEDGNTLMSTEAMAPHGSGFRVGSQYYVLFRNDGNVLHEGSRVTIIVGSLRLAHLTVL